MPRKLRMKKHDLIRVNGSKLFPALAYDTYRTLKQDGIQFKVYINPKTLELMGPSTQYIFNLVGASKTDNKFNRHIGVNKYKMVDIHDIEFK